MKKAVITGAAGFAGYSVTRELVDKGFEVYAVLRPGSEHNHRLCGLSEHIHLIELDQNDFDMIDQVISIDCDEFYHLAWAGKRDDFSEQVRNIDCCIKALESAGKLNCRRFIGIGSQAEYGICDTIMREDITPNPVNAYGAAKIAAMYLSKRRAEQLGIEWIWGRIFSLYGDLEPSGRMLSDLIYALKNNKDISLSSCEQQWDYLHVRDAAKAIVLLGELGHSGEIYNIANGSYRPLKEYVEEARRLFDYTGVIDYGPKADPLVALRPDVTKIRNHTGWKPVIEFDEGVMRFAEEKD